MDLHGAGTAIAGAVDGWAAERNAIHTAREAARERHPLGSQLRIADVPMRPDAAHSTAIIFDEGVDTAPVERDLAAALERFARDNGITWAT